MAQRKTSDQEWSRLPALGAFLALCLLWACGPLRAELLPSSFSGLLPPFAGGAISVGLTAVVAAAFGWRPRVEWPRGQRLLAAIWIGVGLFAIPAVLIHLAAGWISGLARTAVFALVPVFCVVLEPHLGEPVDRPIPQALPASLAALLGTLLVFPVRIPSSVEAAGALAIAILASICLAAANCYASVAFHGLGKGQAFPTVAVVASTGALSLGAASLFLERSRWQSTPLAPGLLWAAAVELPGLLLLFWLLPRLSAVRLATRFVVAPLLAVSIGALLLGIALRPRTCLGLLSMAAGAGYLLLARRLEAEPARPLSNSPPA